MMFQRPATKSAPLFDLLTLYVSGTETPDVLSLARLKRAAADILKTPDVAEGHILYSGIAVLEWDVESAKVHVEKATRFDSSVHTLMNATVTFGAVNRPDLALPYALAASARAPVEPRVINEVSSVLIALGRVTEAAELQRACARVDQTASFEIDAGVLAEGMRAAEVSEDWLGVELRIGRQVLIDEQVRLRQFSYQAESDPDGATYLTFAFGFYGSLNEEFRLEDELAARLSETDRWDPSRLSVYMRHLEPEAHAIVPV